VSTRSPKPETKKRRRQNAFRKTLLIQTISPLRLSLVAIVAVFIAVGMFVVLRSHASSCTVSPQLVPSCGVYWGAYVPSYQLTGLESKVGRKFAVFQEYHDFSTSSNGQIPNSSDLSLMNGGRILLATWQPRVYSAGTNYSWSQIASGSLDTSVIIPQAQRIKALGSTKLFLAFDAEMDDPSTHSASAYGTPDQYVSAYRHIHDVFTAQGATNVVWVWTPTGYSGYYSTLSQFYPGDSYVDWMGYDPYNFYSCGGRTTWNTPATVLSTYYNWVGAGSLGAGAATKPMMLGEYGSHDDPNNSTRNEQWYESVPSAVAGLPRLKALSEFDSVGSCDTRVDAATTQPATLTGFAQAGQNTLFSQQSSTPSPTPTPTSSPTVTATRTPTATDTTAPSAPANLTAGQAGNKTVSLKWSASTDNVGVDHYLIARDGGYGIGTSSSSTFTDSTLSSNGWHTYVVYAVDRAGNKSPGSNQASVDLVGLGLRGSYYPYPNFSGTPLYRTDPVVAFDWGGGSPMAGMPPNNFSARWTGALVPTQSGTYTLSTLTDDGVRLYVNGNLVVNQWYDQPATKRSVNIDLTANQTYTIRMDYYEHAGQAVAKLLWSSSSIAEQAIPEALLYPN
jgi:hypothetical protein